MAGDRGEHGQSQAFRDEIAPFSPVKNDESRAACHRGEQPECLRFGIAVHRSSHRQDHCQRTGEQEGRHDGGVHDACRVKRRGPIRRGNAPVTVSVEQRAERQRIGEQEQPHPDFLRVGPKQRRFVDRRDVVHRRISHAFGLQVRNVRLLGKLQ